MMRLPLFIALVFSASAALAQADIWSHVSPQAGPQMLKPASLTDRQLKGFAHLLRLQKPEEIWECNAADLDGLIKGLRFEWIPVAPQRNLVLAEAPAGCARGGQGANGAMWVIRFYGDRPTLLATPKEFSGWLFQVESTSSHGYPDIVHGWHMSAAEANLSYFRFDGKLYHLIGTATLESDDQENLKIVPNPK
ncbi:MAG: hypothetical protein WBE41_03835 [Terracidiphilus sp.]